VPLDDPTQKLRHGLEGTTLEIDLPEQFLKGNGIRVLRLEMGKFPEPTPMSGLKEVSSNLLARENATPLYSFSGVDYYGSFRSMVGLRWDLLPAENKTIAPEICYSQEEAGRGALFDINGTPTPISFTGGAPFPLPPAGLTWGPVYTNGPQTGFIDHPGGDPAGARPGQRWGDKPWVLREDSQNDSVYHLPAHMLENWYWLQEVTAAGPARTLIRVPTNDGLAVYLNGEQVYVGNNPLQEAGKRTTLLISLRQGKNSLLVKSFNRFGKEVEVGVYTREPQFLYRKALPPIALKAGQPVRMELQNAPDVPVHRDLGMQNVWVVLD
jgi:alpha-L-fucosidase